MLKTTNQKNLNYIIVVSIIGIVFIAFRDYYVSAKAQKSPTPQVTPSVKVVEKSDPDILCQHKYFNFKKDAVWRYKISTLVETKEGRETTTSFFTTRVTRVSSSSVKLTTSFKDQKETVETQLTCKKSGVYGLPFPITVGVDLSSFLPSLRLLPPDENLKKDQSWQTRLNLAPMIDLPADVPVVLNHKVVGAKGSALTVMTDLVFNEETLKSFNDWTDEILQYELKEGVGIIKMTIDAHVEDLIRWKAILQLTDS